MTPDQFDAIMAINDFTEHRYGLGPLEDSFNGDKELLRKAGREAASYGNFDFVLQARKILGIF